MELVVRLLDSVHELQTTLKWGARYFAPRLLCRVLDISQLFRGLKYRTNHIFWRKMKSLRKDRIIFLHQELYLDYHLLLFLYPKATFE